MIGPMDTLRELQSMGLTLPSPAHLAGARLFGLIGWVGFRTGRQGQRPLSTGLGLALMLYPYVVSSTMLLYVLGTAMTAGLLLDRH